MSSSHNSSTGEDFLLEGSNVLNELSTFIDNDKNIPNFVDFTDNQNQKLQELAKKLESIFAEKFQDNIQLYFSPENFSLLGKVLRAFINDLLSSNTPKISETRNAQNDSASFDISKSQINLNSSMDLSDFERIKNDQSETINRLSEMNKSLTKQLEKARKNNEIYEEKCNSLNDSLQHTEFLYQNLQKENAELHEEVNAYKTGFTSLRSKYHTLKKNFSSTNEEVSSMKLALRQLSSENDQLNATLQASSYETQSNKDKKTKQAIEQITNLMDQQYEDISELSNKKNQAITLLSQQSCFIDNLSTSYLKIQEDYAALQEELKIVRQNSEDISQESSEKTIEIQRLKTVFDSSSRAMELIRQALPDFDSEEDITIANHVIELIKNGIPEKSQYKPALDHVLNFLDKICRTNCFSNEDSVEILKEVSTCKKMILQDPNFTVDDAKQLPSIEENIFEISKKLSKNSKDPTLIKAVSSIIGVDSLLRIYCSKLHEQVSNLSQQIRDISIAYGLEGEIEDLPETITNERTRIVLFITEALSLANFIQNENLDQEIQNETSSISSVQSENSTKTKIPQSSLSQTSPISQGTIDNYTKNPIKSLPFILEYMYDSQKIIESFDNELRDKVGFKGDIKNLPKAIREYIDNIISENMLELNCTQQDLNSHIDNIKYEMQQQHKKYENTIKELKEQLQEAKDTIKNDIELTETLSNDNKKLKAENAQLIRENQENFSKFQASIQRHDIILSENEYLKAEKKKLQDSLDSRTKSNQERLQKLLEEQKSLFDEEKQRSQEINDSKIEKLETQLKRKQQQIRENKRKFKEIINEYESLLNQEKATNMTLKKINDFPDVKRLQNENKVLIADRARLSAKIEQLQAATIQAQTARENYWVSQNEITKATLKREADEISNQLIKTHSNFVNSLKSTLSDDKNLLLTKSNGIVTSADEKEVIQAVGKLMSQNSEFAKKINELKIALENQRKPIISCDQKALENAVKKAQEWDRWARNIGRCAAIDIDIGTVDDNKLKNILEEMMMSSIKNHVLLNRLNTLRSQKKILAHNISAPKNQSELSLSIMIQVARAATKMLKITGFSAYH